MHHSVCDFRNVTILNQLINECLGLVLNPFLWINPSWDVLAECVQLVIKYQLGKLLIKYKMPTSCLLFEKVIHSET